MGSGVATKSFALLCFLFLCGTFPSLQAEKHSLYYIYTALSKPVELPGIYEFTAMGLLDDRQIDYYNSKEKRKIPTQHWMKEKMQEDYWEKGTQSRKSKEQWFNVNVNILMGRMKDNDSDVHVLQWRHGCEVEGNGGNEPLWKFSRGIDEYSYDGNDFLSFDDKESRWIAPVDEALPTKRKWDDVPILNQYTKGYLEKECVDWLNKFREYGDEELRNGSPPKVYVSAKKSTSDKLKLSCLATGFYPKDVMLTIRKYRTSLLEDEVESTGVRPNHDGTFQLRKSVNIKEDEKAEYDCFVSHSTLKQPIIEKWDGKCKDCNEGSFMVMGIAIGAVVVGLLVLGICVYLFKTKKMVFLQRSQTNGVANGANGTNQNLLPVCTQQSQTNGVPHANGANQSLLQGNNSNGHVPNGGANGAV
ncbi:zinc-alpha-2-glycoprotein-like isoform X2 [Megalobrama amblycephala]|uniref:zinc-alpha-2-glycoprotein-like isoform X2 n=1 Tax=Megalobrama amblycephala TaxID=75352 RepID=UPI002014457A|nr:zinc-alpha-2-glycoprotein-like isoform X2 [Megalobrama amblycephala]